VITPLLLLLLLLLTLTEPVLSKSTLTAAAVIASTFYGCHTICKK